MLNPIEKIWGIVKSKVKRDLANMMIELLNFRSSNASVREYRLGVLKNLIANAISEITPEICSRTIASIQVNFPLVLNEEDVEF